MQLPAMPLPVDDFIRTRWGEAYARDSECERHTYFSQGFEAHISLVLPVRDELIVTFKLDIISRHYLFLHDSPLFLPLILLLLNKQYGLRRQPDKEISPSFGCFFP